MKKPTVMFFITLIFAVTLTASSDDLLLGRAKRRIAPNREKRDIADKEMVRRILSSKIENSAGPGVFIRDPLSKRIIFVCDMKPGIVVLPKIVIMAEDGPKELVFPVAVSADDGDWFFLDNPNRLGLTFAEGDPRGLMKRHGARAEALTLDTRTGLVFKTSTPLHFGYEEKEENIEEIKVNNRTMEILGAFQPTSRVWIFYQQIPEENITRLLDKILVDWAASHWFGLGWNLVTVSTGHVSDSTVYRYSPTPVTQ